MNLFMNSRDIIKIYAENGKEFVGTNYNELNETRNEYEKTIISKRNKEIAERKEELENIMWNSLTAKLKELNKAVDTYTKESCYDLGYSISNGKLELNRTKSNYIDLDEFLKQFYI